MNVNRFTAQDVPDQSGKTFVVTGANTGLGFEVAQVLASQGGRVLLACRSEEKAINAIQRITRSVPGADLKFIPLDQSDFASVRNGAALINNETRLDALVNNAGVMTMSKEFTSNGLELNFGVNHIGTFLLTLLLLPTLTKTPGSRVVITSSLAHKIKDIELENIEKGEGVAPGKLYSRSKLANLLFLYELNRRLQSVNAPVTAVACHPGMAATDLSRNMPEAVKKLAPVLSKLVNSASVGAWPTLQAACCPDIQPGGYYGPQQWFGIRGVSGPAKRSDLSCNPELAAELWALSEKITGVGMPDNT